MRIVLTKDEVIDIVSLAGINVESDTIYPNRWQIDVSADGTLTIDLDRKEPETVKIPPVCYNCGNQTQRAGSCYVCGSCGSTVGCS